MIKMNVSTQKFVYSMSFFLCYAKLRGLHTRVLSEQQARIAHYIFAA